MRNYRYIFERYTGKNSRYKCPKCGEPHQFSRYIDVKTGEPIADHVGRCNRVNKCHYHYTPKQYFHDAGLKPNHIDMYAPQILKVIGDKYNFKTKTASYISKSIFEKSMTGYKNNNFVKYLLSLFDIEIVNQVINEYQIGTSSRWKGGTTIFWQIDLKGNIRSGKLIKFDPDTGKRIKFKGGSLTNWVHSILGLPNFNLKQCFFGEHLLSKYPNKTVGIVESEKTAIIASIYLPELLWLSAGSANGINNEKVKALGDREVILFPDASIGGKIYNTWKEISEKFGFSCSDYLEKNAASEQKIQGIDIADLLGSIKLLSSPVKNFLAKYPIINKLFEEIRFIDLTITNIDKKESFRYPEFTQHIPYSTPSPAAVIDSKVDTQMVFVGVELVVKYRNFKTESGDRIELVGLRDYGYCRNWGEHLNQEGFCRECVLNCLHTIKINGRLQDREYSQLEILIMQ